MIVQEEHNASQSARVRLRGPENGESAGLRELARAVTVFGAGQGCDVVLPADKVDAAHAAIVLLGNTAYLCDFGAPGGTALNGRRIRWARLADGDELAVNTCRFRVELEEDATALTGEQPSFKLRDDKSIGDVMTIDPVLIVGSDPACDVVLHDDAVAPRHCLVIWTQDGPILRHLQEGDRLRLNGESVESAHLVSGDRISVGPYEMTFEIEGAPRASGGMRQDYPGNVRLQSGRTVLYRGEQSHTPALVSGRLGDGETSDWEVLWPGDPDDETREFMETRCDTPETHEEEESTVDSNFAMEDEQTESAELTQPSPSTGQGNRTEAEACGKQSGSSEDRLARVRSRVAAAQKALDQRALKHLEQLNDERLRLRAYQADLQKKASELLRVAHKNRHLLGRDHSGGEGDLIGAKASEELTALGQLVSEMQAIEETHATAAQSHNGEDSGILGDVLYGQERRSLQERAGELAELVRCEQDEIDRAESQLASLRTGIRRMRDFVERTGIRLRAKASELEMLLGTLRREEASLTKERELLMAKLQEVEGRMGRVAVKVQDAGHDREDLDREGEQLAQVQKKLVEKEEALRTGLELERQRIQVRQTELQRKATELARAARDKRCAIEAEISKRRAALDLQEAELRVHRAAIEEAGRNELEKAASELERVLSVRLADIEAEMSAKPGGNGSASHQEAATSMSCEPAPASAVDQPNMTFADVASSENAALASMVREAAEGRGRRLTALQAELAALRDAMSKLGKQNDASAKLTDDETRTLRASQPAIRRDRRWSATELGGQLDMSHAMLRGAEDKSDDRTAVGSEATAATSDPGGPHGGGERSDGR